MSGDLVVETTNGAVRGADTGATRVWRGIPFAAPPVGDLRWRAPQPAPAWTGVRDASRFGSAAPQPRFPMFDLGAGVDTAEDCLFLNVRTPRNDGSGRPVMVFLHGGGYIIGSSSQPMYEGESLVVEGDVVLVTVNYRPGAFGFLELGGLGDDAPESDTNRAVRDAIAALEWVRENIAAFGGDPDCVTLFGESAGGGLVTALMTVPSAAGLFHRAIAQSAPATSIYNAERAAATARRFVELADVRLDELADVGVDRLLAASNRLFDTVPRDAPGTLAFAPVVDGDLVPDYPVEAFRSGRSHPVPMIIGTNRNEAALFRLIRSPILPITANAIRGMFAQLAVERPELVVPAEADVLTAYARLGDGRKGMAMARDLAFRLPTVWVAEGHSATAPTYVYRYDWSSRLLRVAGVGATHAAELPYVFGGIRRGRPSPAFALGGLTNARAVSRRMQRLWTSFARFGLPIADPGDPLWADYRPEFRAVRIIDARDRVVNDPDRRMRETWGDAPLTFT